MKSSKISDPYNPRLINFAVNLFGKRSNKICEPSSGGIGIRLKAKRKILKNTPYQKMLIILSLTGVEEFTNKRKQTKNNTARIKFDSGPAKETIASSLYAFLKLLL